MLALATDVVLDFNGIIQQLMEWFRQISNGTSQIVEVVDFRFKYRDGKFWRQFNSARGQRT
jgi:hypothetical protein